MDKKLEAEYKTSRAWIVSQSDEDVYEVHSQPSVLVDVNRRTCSCYQWQVNGFQCSHAVVAFRNSGRNIYDLIESYHHVTEFRAMYSESIHHIPTVEKPSVTPNEYIIAPSATKHSQEGQNGRGFYLGVRWSNVFGVADVGKWVTITERYARNRFSHSAGSTYSLFNYVVFFVTMFHIVRYRYMEFYNGN
ncbi:hypothetical protein ACSBR1_026084 [Camellia fascicularis]